MIQAEKITSIAEQIVAGYNPERIILFGSYAHGNPTEDSDIDLLIIKETNLSRPERFVQVRKSLIGTGVPIDLIVYTPAEIAISRQDQYGFIYEALNTGRVLYERSN